MVYIPDSVIALKVDTVTVSTSLQVHLLIGE